MNIREVFTYLAMSRAELRNTFAAALAKVGLSGAEAAVVYEQSMSTGFGQSCRGYVLLRYLGYPKIRVLHGGYAAWVAAGGYPARRRFCQQMLGSLKAWEADCPSGAPMLFVISTWTAEENRAMNLRSPVVFDHDSRGEAAFGANGTPMGVLIDATGRIASELAAGRRP